MFSIRSAENLKAGMKKRPKLQIIEGSVGIMHPQFIFSDIFKPNINIELHEL